MTALHGHRPLVTAFLDAARSGRLHHAWLLAGPQGIGKARFADAAALRLLAESAGPPVQAPGLDVPADHPIAKLVAAGSHPDLRRLERLAKDKSEELARSISIAQVRALQALFATTPSLSPRRVVIIDAIDDLERPAANALLKNLEEPPADTLFLLVSHAPGRLLPTIRSRCRLLRFSPLDAADTAAVLREALPEAEEAEIGALVSIAGGAPGTALRFAGLDVAGLDAAMERLIAHGDPTNAERVALARALSLKAAQPRYEIFLERAPARIAAQAHRLSGPALARAIALWEEARGLADGAVRLSLDPQATVFELAGLLARLAPEPAPAKA
ncbi:DNA polymerase III subunit delta' [Sphingomonas oleivorans]|uniref:DNA polymerase III subunit delta n=1 Tax=Sphingomonas oleivorans TaxID=1735121 RepID=A0A2T5FYK3_9SPHN|nr:DNA polymerase III subunit delta' [Sphingomonas oleivorans]PTQ11623.1 DNA polymerase III subunit delta' [Sphingomonas oleivorans]